MSKSWHLTIGNINLGTAPTGQAQPRSDSPFRILILGDFGAQSGPDGPTVLARRPIRVDRDNFDEVLAKANVEVRLPATTGNAAPIRVREMDDFHPDRLFRSVQAFDALRDLKRRLNNPSTFAAAAAEVAAWSSSLPAGPTAPPASAPAPQAPAVASENLLEQILQNTPSSQSTPAEGMGSLPWTEFFRQVAEKYAIPPPDPRQSALIAQVDAAAGALMRGLLHHAAFQEVEAAWRAVYFLVQRLDTDANLQVYLFQLPRTQLAADLEGDDFEHTKTCKLLVEGTPDIADRPPWAVLAGNYTFDLTPGDVRLLGRLGQVARRAGAPFLTGAQSRIVGCRSLAETPDPDDWQESADVGAVKAWQALRRQPEATHLYLALPRFLARLPYGKGLAPVEELDFEEMPGVPRHESYLWGNPAFLWAYVLGRTFAEQGWQMQLGNAAEVDGLPLHVYKEDGESQLKPCAEVVLRERAVRGILDKGLMPLLSHPGQDVVRLASFQPLAFQETP
jgi:type VI secretion system protein ImpC